MLYLLYISAVQTLSNMGAGY